MACDIAVVSFNCVPPLQETLKYLLLGGKTQAALHAYCLRHSYVFYDAVPKLGGLHPCWGKLTALANALENHEWALWIDSDAILTNPSRRLESLLDERGDFLAQEPFKWFDLLGLPPERGLRWQPINAGVFFLRRSAWARDVLRQALSCAPASQNGMRWNGLGDQEALTNVLLRTGALDPKVAYIEGLQDPPQSAENETMFVHLYGNHASYRYNARQCTYVVSKLLAQIDDGPLRLDDLALLHWCAIQNLSADCPVSRGDPAAFGYAATRLDAAMGRLCAINTH